MSFDKKLYRNLMYRHPTKILRTTNKIDGSITISYELDALLVKCTKKQDNTYNVDVLEKTYVTKTARRYTTINNMTRGYARFLYDRANRYSK